MLDTTWRVIPHYVKTILNASFLNTRHLIPFAIGSVETTYLYQLLLQTTEDQFNIDFKDNRPI